MYQAIRAATASCGAPTIRETRHDGVIEFDNE